MTLFATGEDVKQTKLGKASTSVSPAGRESKIDGQSPSSSMQTASILKSSLPRSSLPPTTMQRTSTQGLEFGKSTSQMLKDLRMSMIVDT